KVTATAQGQSQELPAEAATAYQSLLLIFPELTYATDGDVALELDGITKVNDEDAYKVKVTRGDNASVAYYSVASGIKLKTETELSGEMTVDGYATYDGIQLPETVTIVNKMMPMPLKAVTKTVVMNGDISDEELQ